MDFKVFASALRIRMIEQEISARYSEGKMRCPIHLSIGQEMQAAELCSYLTKDDLMVSGHRAHAHYLAKGGNLGKLIAELYGKEAGCSRGFGGSMHLVDQTCGFYGSTSIVASTIPIGVGLALNKKMQNERGIVVVCFGDAALEEGVTHESMNFAVLHKLPVLFFCENNQYSCNTHLSSRQPYTRLNFLNNVKNNGDIETCVKSARNFEPIICEIHTERFAEHCGPAYKIEEHDSLNRVAKRFQTRIIESWREFCAGEITEAFQFAEAAAFPTELMRPLCEQ